MPDQIRPVTSTGLTYEHATLLVAIGLQRSAEMRNGFDTNEEFNHDRVVTSNGLFTVIAKDGTGTVYLVVVRARCAGDIYKVAVQPYEHGHISGNFNDMRMVRSVTGMIRLIPGWS